MHLFDAVELPPHPWTLAASRRFVGALLDRAAISPAVQDELTIAVSEACSNVVPHSPAGNYRLAVEIHDDCCVIEVRDTGPGSESEALQGVIEFYETTLTITATLAMQTQNERIQRLTETSYAQSEQVKKISAWAAIFFAPTLIGTVYGMNFDHMPELRWAIGYPLALLAMVLASVALHRVFKRQRWL